MAAKKKKNATPAKPRVEITIVPSTGKSVKRKIPVPDGGSLQVAVRDATGSETTNLNVSVNGAIVTDVANATVKAGDKVQVEERPSGS